MAQAADILIVGNGIIGVSLADEMSQRQPDAKVIVVGPSARLGAATPAAGAMLGCFGEVTKDTLASGPSRAKFELSLAAHRQWPARLEALGAVASAHGERLHRVEGTHVILNGRSGALDSLNFAAMVEVLKTSEESWEEVDPLEIDGLSPLPDARPLRAIHLPAEGAVDSNQVLGVLERKVASAGVDFIDGEVAALTTEGGEVSGARLADGRSVDAPRIVVAAGASSARLLRTVLPLDRVLPMYAGSGIAFVGQRVIGSGFKSVVRTPNRSGACGLHLIPLGGGREYLGATNVLFADPEPATYVGVGHFLSECAMEQLDQRIFFHRICEWRMGNRPVTLDTFPIIGWTDIGGLYVVSGTYRDGFHCSEVLAEHAAGELLGGHGALELGFEPQRRPITLRSIDEAVEEFSLHSASGWFEAGAQLPGFVTSGALAEMLARRARDLHDELGLDFGLAPEIVMFLLDSRKNTTDLKVLRDYLQAIA